MSWQSPSISLETHLLVQTQRLTLRSLCEDHLPQYREIVCNPLTGRFDEEFPKTPQQAAESFQESISCAPLTFGAWNEYGVFDEQNHLVGLVSHLDSEKVPGERMSRVGYHFHPAFQGKGYATESVRGLLSLLQEQGQGLVECVVHPDNKPSVSLLERLGFSPVCFDPEHNEIRFHLRLVAEL